MKDDYLAVAEQQQLHDEAKERYEIWKHEQDLIKLLQMQLNLGKPEHET